MAASVTPATKVKRAALLFDKYVDIFEAKYPGVDSKVNKFRDKWGFLDMLEDVGNLRSVEIIEYYFSTPRRGHPIQYLLYNYDKINLIMRELADDVVKREELRLSTEQRVKEWELKNGNG